MRVDFNKEIGILEKSYWQNLKAQKDKRTQLKPSKRMDQVGNSIKYQGLNTSKNQNIQTSANIKINNKV